MGPDSTVERGRSHTAGGGLGALRDCSGKRGQARQAAGTGRGEAQRPPQICREWTRIQG